MLARQGHLATLPLVTTSGMQLTGKKNNQTPYFGEACRFLPSWLYPPSFLISVIQWFNIFWQFICIWLMCNIQPNTKCMYLFSKCNYSLLQKATSHNEMILFLILIQCIYIYMYIYMHAHTYIFFKYWPTSPFVMSPLPYPRETAVQAVFRHTSIDSLIWKLK